MVKQIWRHFGVYKKYVYIGIIFVLIDVILEMLIPAYMAKIIDIGIANRDVNYILRTGSLMVVFGIFATILGGANGFLTSKSSNGMAYNLRKNLLDKVMGFSAENIDEYSTASLITRLTTDVNMMQMATMMSLRLLVRGPLFMVIGLYMAYRINAKLSLIFVVVMPLILICLYFIFRYVVPIFSVTQKKLDALNQVVQENVSGQRVVKAFVRQTFEKEKFAFVNEDQVNTALKALTVMTMMMPILMLALNSATVAALWFGGLDVGMKVSGMGIGELNSFITYIFRSLVAFMPIAMVLMLVARSTASSQRIAEVLATESTINQNVLTGVKEVINGDVTFDNVSFSYPDSMEGETLKDISLGIPSGSFTAFISSTGGGKSTLVNLIPRLYDVTSGELYIGDKPIRSYDLEKLRDAIGVVQQKNVLFSGTVRDNIKWGKEDATNTEVVAAAKAAQAHDFIMNLPEGYDTWIEQGGTNVSGGQRQRLCIARALIKKPKILILDDSTSALDTATEARIQQTFSEELEHTTILMVAQRISSVMKADQIVVLEEGQISGIGTHESLLRDDKIYQEIYQSQNEEVA